MYCLTSTATITIRQTGNLNLLWVTKIYIIGWRQRSTIMWTRNRFLIRNPCSLTNIYQFSAISIAVHKQEEEITERMLQQYAQHWCAKSANLYMGNARLVARTIAEDPKMLLKNPVPKFREIMLIEEGQNLNRLHQLSQQTCNIKTLSQAAKFFVKNMLCVYESSKYYRNIPYLLKKAIIWISRTTRIIQPSKQFSESCQNHDTPESAERTWTKVHTGNNIYITAYRGT